MPGCSHSTATSPCSYNQTGGGSDSFSQQQAPTVDKSHSGLAQGLLTHAIALDAWGDCSKQYNVFRKQYRETCAQVSTQVSTPARGGLLLHLPTSLAQHLCNIAMSSTLRV